VRAARAGDFRRRLRERANEWPFRLNGFSFVGVPSLGEGDLQFLSPLTVISGPNGVGKTTLLVLSVADERDHRGRFFARPQ
jgi:predicted ATPase